MTALACLLLFDHDVAPSTLRRTLQALPVPNRVILAAGEGAMRLSALRDEVTAVGRHAEFIAPPGRTAGGACTALLAIGAVDPSVELLVIDAEAAGNLDVAARLPDLRATGHHAGMLLDLPTQARLAAAALVPDHAPGSVPEAASAGRTDVACVQWWRRAEDFFTCAGNAIRKAARGTCGATLNVVMDEAVLLGMRVRICLASGAAGKVAPAE